MTSPTPCAALRGAEHTQDTHSSRTCVPNANEPDFGLHDVASKRGIGLVCSERARTFGEKAKKKNSAAALKDISQSNFIVNLFALRGFRQRHFSPWKKNPGDMCKREARVL